MNAHLGFNPRSQANSNALADFIISDLQTGCPALAADLRAGKIIPEKNADVRTRVACRNVDLVLAEAAPVSAVRAAVENKTIMTAHGKARLNRYGDVIAYSNHVHNHRRECIAAAVVIVNCSPAYANPDGFAKGLVRPRFDMQRIVRDTVKIFAEIPLRTAVDEPSDQPESLAVFVVDYDGEHPAKLVTSELAPPGDSPINYSNFLDRICALYANRFAR
jgi:hypothetical protein